MQINVTLWAFEDLQDSSVSLRDCLERYRRPHFRLGYKFATITAAITTTKNSSTISATSHPAFSGNATAVVPNPAVQSGSASNTLPTRRLSRVVSASPPGGKNVTILLGPAPRTNSANMSNIGETANPATASSISMKIPRVIQTAD
jgi:hypothetical protein